MNKPPVWNERIIERFLSDEFSDCTVLTELGAKYGATNVAAALRAELRAARELGLDSADDYCGHGTPMRVLLDDEGAALTEQEVADLESLLVPETVIAPMKIVDGGPPIVDADLWGHAEVVPD